MEREPMEPELKHLVTGASGFAGKYLVSELLEQGHEVIAMVRREGTAPEGSTETVADLTDQDRLQQVLTETQPDGVFHLGAAQTSVGASWKDPEGTKRENLATTEPLLAAIQSIDQSPKTIVISSSEVLGTVPEDQQPLDESTSPHPESPYAESKLEVEKRCQTATEAGAPVIIVRAFNHIGPGQNPRMALPSFAEQIAEIEETGQGEIKVGNLEARRDFSDVRDMVRAYTTLMEKGQTGEIYHAGSGKVHSMDDLLQSLIKISPATIETVVDPSRVRPTDIPLLCADASKLRALGWEPRIELTETLTEILEEARQRRKE